MKKIILLISVFILSCISIWLDVNAWIFSWNGSEIEICKDWECSLDKWIELTKWVDDVQTEGKASEYIQKIVSYVITFLGIVAVLMIIYAWFNILTSAWDDEKVSSSKKIIIYSWIWLLVIFLAGPIVKFIIKILNLTN